MMPNVRTPSSTDSKSSTLLNRMHAVVEKCRSPNSNGGRPIDLTDAEDGTPSRGVPPVLTNHDSSTQRTKNDDDDEDYIPPGLADFVAAANRELEKTQEEFLNFTPSATTWEPEDLTYQLNASSTSLREDAEDRALKGEILDRFAQTDADLTFSPNLLPSPSFNPVIAMSDSQIKRQALGGAFTPPPPPYHVVVAASGNSFVSPSSAPKHPTAPTSTHASHHFFESSPTDLNRGQNESFAERAKGNALVSPHALNPSVASAINQSLPSPPQAAMHVKASVSKDNEFSLESTFLPSEPDFYFSSERDQEVVLDTEDATVLQPDVDSEIMLDHGDLIQLSTDDVIDPGGPSPLTDAATGVLSNDRTLTDVGAYNMQTTPAKKGPEFLSETAQTPSPLSMSSPSKASIANKRKEEFFAEQLRCSHRVRASSPVYGLAPAPEEHLNLSARLAADAARVDARPPTPASSVTGPVPLSAKKQTPIRPKVVSAVVSALFADAKGATSPPCRTGSPFLSSFSEVKPIIPLNEAVNYQTLASTQTQPVVNLRRNPSPSPSQPDVTNAVRGPSPLSKSSDKNISIIAESSINKSTSLFQEQLLPSGPNQVAAASPRNVVNHQATTESFLNKQPLPIVAQVPANDVTTLMMTPSPRDTENQQTSSAGSSAQRPSPPLLSSLVPPGTSKAMPAPSPQSVSIGNKAWDLAKQQALSAESYDQTIPTPNANQSPLVVPNAMVNSAARNPLNQLAPSTGSRNQRPSPHDLLNSRNSPSPMSMSSVNKMRRSAQPVAALGLSNNNHAPMAPPPISTQVTNGSEVCNKRATPSPLSMASPRYEIYGESRKTTPSATSSSTHSPPPPRFSPPPSPQIKRAARFTAETAERLSTPASKSPLPPQMTSEKKSSARFTAEAAERLYKQSTKALSPQPTRTTQFMATFTQEKVGAQRLAKSVDRLSRPKSARQLVKQAPGTAVVPPPVLSSNQTPATPSITRQEALTQAIAAAVNENLSPSRPDDSHEASKSSNGVSVSQQLLGLSTTPAKKLGGPRSNSSLPMPPAASSPHVSDSFERLSIPKVARTTVIQHAIPQPSAAVFTSESAERLCKPTFARRAAIRAASPRRHPSPGTNSAHGNDNSHNETRDAISRNEVATTATECYMQLSEKTPPRPSPRVFKVDSAERFNRLTYARSAAIIAASPRRHSSPGSINAHGNLDGHEGRQGGNSTNHSLTAAHERLITQMSGPSPHLLQGTAVSEARKTTPNKPVVLPPPPRRIVSGASDRLMSRTVANKAAIDGGPAKARERVRKRMLDQQRQQLILSEGPGQSPVKHKFSAEDGIAKARERLRQRQSEEKRQKIPAKNSQGVGSDIADTGAGSRAARPPSGKRAPTVPQGPNFATTARHGERPAFGRSDMNTLAQSVDVFGKGLRDDMSASVGSNGSSHRNLTIPHGPKFATDIRCGESFKPPRARSDVSLAQSTDVLQMGLRAPYAAPAVKRGPGPTIPHSPKFHKAPHRELPKSSEERELEEMEYFKSHPFRANPIASGHYHNPANRRITMTPQSANFLCDSSNGLPLPSYMQPTLGHAARAQPTPPTTHARVVATPRVHCKTIVNETPKPFRARPAPLSTFQAPSPISPSSSPPTPTEPFHLATSCRQDKHSAMTEASRRRTELLAQEREAQAAIKLTLLEEAHQKKIEEERRQRRRRLAKLTPHLMPSQRKTTEAHPFRVASIGRFEASSAEEARLRLTAEDEERRKQTAFKAKPVPKSTYSYKPIAPKPSVPLVTPFSPELQTKQRVVARKEYDVYADQEREVALAQARAMEVQRLADEQNDLHERRRLSVKEGGMIPIAEPVNAVFLNDCR